MKKAFEDLVKEYIVQCLVYAERYALPDDGSCLRAKKRILKLYCAMRDLGEPGIKAMEQLLEHPNRYVRTSAAFKMAWLHPLKALQIIEEDFAIGDEYGRSHEPWLWGARCYPNFKHSDPYEWEKDRLAEQRSKREKAKARKQGQS